MKPSVALMLGVALGTLGACSSGSRIPPGNSSEDDFSVLQKSYFKNLDFRVPGDELRSIPAFAARLSGVADQAKADEDRGLLPTQEARERAGLVFIYDSLMTLNNTFAVERGNLPFSSLTQARRFDTDEGDQKQELKARIRYAIDEQERAARLRPEDRRVDSWLAAMKRDLDVLEKDGTTEAMLIASLDAIPARPTFNLWTALLLFKDQDPSSPLFARLVGEAKKFVDGVSHGANPCRDRPRDCQNGPLAPYNSQASITILGDAFLRRAESLIRSGNTAQAMEMAAYARGTYAKLDSPAYVHETRAWPEYPALVERRLYASAFKPGLQINHSFVENRDYPRVYECASCHGRNN